MKFKIWRYRKMSLGENELKWIDLMYNRSPDKQTINDKHQYRLPNTFNPTPEIAQTLYLAKRGDVRYFALLVTTDYHCCYYYEESQDKWVTLDRATKRVRRIWQEIFLEMDILRMTEEL